MQITNPVAEQSLNAEQGVGKVQDAAPGAVNSQIAQNNQNVGGQINLNNDVAHNQAGQQYTAAENANTNLQSLLSGVQGNIHDAQGNLAPALASGAQGNKGLQEYAASNPQFHAPTADEVAKTPGYQFQLQQGANAITNQAAAQGGSMGGKALADLTQYGQGLAGTYYQNAFNNAQSQFQTNQNATLSNLQALIGSGATANNQNLEATGLGLQAATGLGGQQSQNMIGAAKSAADIYGQNAGINTGAQQSLAGQNLSGQLSLQNLLEQGAVEEGNFAQNYGQAQAGQNIGNSNAIRSGIGSLVGLL